jgi:hypothetical protein
MWRVNPQMGHVATDVVGSTTRYEVQPFVLQYGRLAVDERRRIRRIATDRPATEAVAVRDIMACVLVPSGSRVSRALTALVTALRPVLVRSSNGSVSRAGAEPLGFLTRGVGERVGLDRMNAATGDEGILPPNGRSVNRQPPG